MNWASSSSDYLMLWILEKKLAARSFGLAVVLTLSGFSSLARRFCKSHCGASWLPPPSIIGNMNEAICCMNLWISSFAGKSFRVNRFVICCIVATIVLLFVKIKKPFRCGRAQWNYCVLVLYYFNWCKHTPSVWFGNQQQQQVVFCSMMLIRGICVKLLGKRSKVKKVH